MSSHGDARKLQQAIDAHRARRHAQAESLFRELIDSPSQRIAALRGLGTICFETNRLDEAEQHFRAACDDRRAPAACALALGITLRMRGNQAGAIDAWIDALRRDPTLTQALHNLTLGLIEAGRWPEVETYATQLVRQMPGNAEAHAHRAMALWHIARRDEAIQAMSRAAELAPRRPDFHQQLAAFLVWSGHPDEAADAMSRAVQHLPNDATIHAAHGDLLLRVGRHDEAVPALRRALALDHTNAAVHTELCDALRKQGKLDEAAQAGLAAVQRDPNLAEAHYNLALVRHDQGLVPQMIDSLRAALAIQSAPQPHSSLLLALHYEPHDPPEIFTEHQRFDVLHAQPLSRAAQPLVKDAQPDRRLRVGYISPDFRRHPVAMFFEPLLSNHDRGQFEITLYSDLLGGDAYTSRLKSSADRWRQIAGIPDEHVARMVREDQIDILVELTGHTGFNRLLVMARRPAPVQVTYIGYVDTTGLTSIDYRFTDAWHDPLGETDHLHSEKLVRLDGGAWAFRPDDDAPDVVPLPADERDHVTFCSPNKIAKVTDEMVRLWARILEQVPASRLMIVTGGDTEGQARLRNILKDIDASRIDLLGRTSRSQYYTMYQRADLALDAFPHNGHTTSVDALWMGVPVVTLAGQTHSTRMGLSVLSSVGLTELVCRSPEEYLAKAIELAQDRPRLRALRAGMRERMRRSGLMDGARLARAIESHYRSAWREFCSKH